ncbi:ferritin-like domain-containing protein [Trichloromonas sp.]|uniref:ferritin-like domain-containing protein n=1 Tax=Trichloromonas sp. TaxID=3069249 RepID=UPI002A417AC8|nr:ferritin family protein [Trichloromonas sp.]
MNGSRPLREAIRAALRTEKEAMDFYRAAAQRLSDPEAAALFSRLAREERQHAYSFYTLDRRHGDLPPFEDLLATPPDTTSSWWRALQSLAAENFTAQAALRLAIAEERRLETELRTAAAGIDDLRARSIYLANAASTQCHWRSLEALYAERYGA